MIRSVLLAPIEPEIILPLASNFFYVVGWRWLMADRRDERASANETHSTVSTFVVELPTPTENDDGWLAEAD